MIDLINFVRMFEQFMDEIFGMFVQVMNVKNVDINFSDEAVIYSVQRLFGDFFVFQFQNGAEEQFSDMHFRVSVNCVDEMFDMFFQVMNVKSFMFVKSVNIDFSDESMVESV